MYPERQDIGNDWLQLWGTELKKSILLIDTLCVNISEH